MESIQRIELKPSRLLAWICGVAHAAALTVITVVSMEMWLKLLAMAALAASCGHSMRIAFLRTPDSASGIEVTSEDALSIRTRASQWLACDVLDSTYVASFLTVLNLREKAARRRRHVVLLPDGIDPDDFRRLRTWLRWRSDAARN